MRITVALLASLSPVLLAQNGATVEGTVTNSVTHAGIGGVEVRLLTKDANRYEVITDAAGGFRVTDIKDGEYSVITTKSGFVSFDARDLMRRAVRVGFGKDLTRVDLQMAPLATLRGRVVDSEGRPAAEVEVQAGGPRNVVTTDEEGRFAFENLEAGSYRLLATSEKTAGAAKPAEGDRVETVPTYFPSVMDAPQAEQIRVASGDNLSGYEIRLRTAPVYRVRGVVVDEAGKPIAKPTVQLMARTGGPGGIGMAMSAGGARRYMIGVAPGGTPVNEIPVAGDDGSFEFPAVRAGEWRIDAEAEWEWDGSRHLPKTLRGGGEVIVEHKDLDNVRIRVLAPFPLDVEVEAEGLPPGMPKERLMVLSPVDGRRPVAVSDRINEGMAAFPGRYRIGTMTGEYYVASATLGGRDVLGQIIDLQPGSPPLKVVFKNATGRVRGVVENGEGAVVLVWPQKPDDFVTVDQVPCGVNGSFDVSGLLSGDYYAAAFDRVPILSDPAVLQNVVGIATSVRVDDGATAAVQLRVNRWPE
jgi:hypothetical protein